MAANNLRAFVVTHSGNYLGGLSVAVAVDEADAHRLVLAELTVTGMPNETIYATREIDLTRPHARVHDNGDY